jgi:hypothetical protein
VLNRAEEEPARWSSLRWWNTPYAVGGNIGYGEAGLDLLCFFLDERNASVVLGTVRRGCDGFSALLVPTAALVRSQ